MKTFFTVYF